MLWLHPERFSKRLSASPAIVSTRSLVVADLARCSSLHESPSRNEEKPSVPPGRHVGAWRCSLFDAIENLPHVHLVISQPRDRIWQCGVAVPAMFGPVTVRHFPSVE